MNSPLRVVPLGGLGEVGMNCLALELDDSIVVIDCGVTFPDSEPGVDIIHPDFSYLLEHRARIEAVVITHGHEDHIGALPYLLADIDVPVYAPPYAVELVKVRLSEFRFDFEPRVLPIAPRQKVQAGAFEIEPFRVTHSIPDALGLVLRTRAGTLVHSGDFKIDPAPPDSELFDIDFVEEVGRAGVRLLMSDSTNVDVEGTSGPESDVAVALDRQIRAATGRVVVSMFGSNIYRLAAVLRTAQALNKQTLVLGRAVQTHTRLADKQGLLPKPLPTFISPEMAQAIPRDQLLVIASGSQAEPRAALARLSKGAHHQLKLEADDTVILSARVIPGRERGIHALVDDLERLGVRVVQRYDDAKLHVSGHACRDEQRRLIRMVNPRTFVAVHGTYHHLRRHAALARECGVIDAPVIENGMVLEVDDAGSRIATSVEAGRVHVQAGTELADVVLRDRVLMAEVGIVVITITMDADGGIAQSPQVLTRGVVWEDEEDELLSRVSDDIERTARRLGKRASDDDLREAACRTARRIFRDEVGFRPLTHCIVARPET